MIEHPDRRLRRLAEELSDAGLECRAIDAGGLILEEVDYALRPRVHERRVPTYGAFIAPAVEPKAWEAPTGLTVTRRPFARHDDGFSRRFADGLSSWAVRDDSGISQLLSFDRAAASERDLVVLANAAQGAVVQRHPSGTVRIVGPLGLLRWDGVRWHHEPPVQGWIEGVAGSSPEPFRSTLRRLVEFAVYDLGARGIGALLVVRADTSARPSWESHYPAPPELDITEPVDLAPLHHVLAQTDGATVFDDTGRLRWLGVRLVPSRQAEAGVATLRGTRHTAARRYSYDDRDAIVIAVSEDGPVTVLHGGEVLGRSPD